jgi:cell shape-determining protein MreC
MTDDTMSHAEALSSQIERACALGLAEIDRLTVALNEVIDERAGFLAEIARLNRTNSDLAALLREQGCRLLDMQDRITALEAEIATLRGTLAAPTPDDDQPTIIHHVPPNAPPHNE